MSNATSNRTALHRVKEVNWGITPANPPLTETRYTGEALDDAISFEKSKEIRADRMLADTIPVDSSPAGSFNFELSYGTYTDLLVSAMMSALSAPLNIVGVAGDIETLAAAADNLESSTAGKFANIVVGQKVRLSGWTAAGVNRIYTVTAKASDQVLTLDPQPTDAETPALALAHVDGQYVRNGVTEQSYTLVKTFNDTTVATRQVFTGMRVKGFSLELATASILTGVFNFMGRSGLFTESTFAGETFPAVSTTTILNAVTNVTTLYQDDATTGSVSTMSLEFDNQHREQKAIGTLGNIGVVAGQLMINVTAEIYFESMDQATMFKNGTAFKYSFSLRDDVGNEIHFTLPRCKYESFTVNSTGLDSDVMASTTFAALRDTPTNCMIQIDFFPAA